MDSALNITETVKTHHVFCLLAALSKQVVLVYVNGHTAHCFDPL